MNPEQYMKARKGLLEPASEAAIANVEKQLRVTLPSEFRAFLKWADGGIMPGGKVIIYSAGSGIHPDETLLAANENRNTEEPLLFFARESGEEFVFKVSDVIRPQCPVYVYAHEDDEVKEFADSFASFAEWATHSS